MNEFAESPRIELKRRGLELDRAPSQCVSPDVAERIAQETLKRSCRLNSRKRRFDCRVPRRDKPVMGA